MPADLHGYYVTDAPPGHIPNGRSTKIVQVQTAIGFELFSVFSLGWNPLTQAGTDTQRIPFIARIDNMLAASTSKNIVIGFLPARAFGQELRNFAGHFHLSRLAVLRFALPQLNPAIEEIYLADSQAKEFTLAETEIVSTGDEARSQRIVEFAARTLYSSSVTNPCRGFDSVSLRGNAGIAGTIGGVTRVPCRNMACSKLGEHHACCSRMVGTVRFERTTFRV
jgi:hypothetical protein